MTTATFQHKPSVRETTLIEHRSDLLNIEAAIKERLNDYPNFIGVNFSDDYSGTTQIRGYHKEIDGYFYGKVIDIDYSNTGSSVCAFIEMWEQADTSKNLREFQLMLEEGARYGWH